MQNRDLKINISIDEAAVSKARLAIQGLLGDVEKLAKAFQSIQMPGMGNALNVTGLPQTGSSAMPGAQATAAGMSVAVPGAQGGAGGGIGGGILGGLLATAKAGVGAVRDLKSACEDMATSAGAKLTGLAGLFQNITQKAQAATTAVNAATAPAGGGFGGMPGASSGFGLPGAQIGSGFRVGVGVNVPTAGSFALNGQQFADPWSATIEQARENADRTVQGGIGNWTKWNKWKSSKLLFAGESLEDQRNEINSDEYFNRNESSRRHTTSLIRRLPSYREVVDWSGGGAKGEAGDH